MWGVNPGLIPGFGVLRCGPWMFPQGHEERRNQENSGTIKNERMRKKIKKTREHLEIRTQESKEKRE
jgi:hypothetical protein